MIYIEVFVSHLVVLLWDRIADAAAVAHYLGNTGPNGGVCTARGASTYKAATGNPAPNSLPGEFPVR
jgi:hypothetical protein